MKSFHQKGQFYVECIHGEESPDVPGYRVPVDNFVFYHDNGTEVRLAGHGQRTVVTYGNKRKKFEWFDNHSQGLRRMADILDGKVKFADFGNKNENN